MILLSSFHASKFKRPRKPRRAKMREAFHTHEGCTRETSNSMACRNCVQCYICGAVIFPECGDFDPETLASIEEGAKAMGDEKIYCEDCIPAPNTVWLD
jgi:hypothetical protein